jgi:hypothetical protein
MRRSAWPAALLPPILLLAYRGGLGRGFASEDFLILRRLGSGDFWARAAENFAGPWLGATFVPFYRPFSSLLLQAELLLFGVRPLPYLLLHLAVHAGCALLLGAWLRRLLPAASRAEVFLATLLFALYPLHPNTVLFVASFATLFATFSIFAALYFEAAGKCRLAWAAAALALLCYEQAVVLPALLLLFDLATKNVPWRERLRRLWPYFALAFAFLLLRGAVLGSLGGYAGFRERLLDPAALSFSLGELVARLFLPFFALPAPPALAFMVAAALAILAGVAIRRRADPGARLLLAALAAIPLSQAPFSFAGVVPGNGRYFYLASAWVAIVLWQALRLLPRPEKLAAPALGAVAIVFFWGLGQVATVYGEAGEKVRAVRAALESAPPGRLFVAGRPYFVHRWGVPVAQVFHWGLADAAMPPFTKRSDLAVYPLPELSDADLAPLLDQPELGRVMRLGDGDRLLPAAAPETRLDRLEALPVGRRPALRVTLPAGSTGRLVVLARGGPSLLPLPPAEGETIAEIPPDTFEGMRRLYEDPIFAWVEARGEGGDLVAASQVFAFF